MKRISIAALLLFSIVVSQAGQTGTNPLANGYSSSEVSELGSFVNRLGTHTLYLWKIGTDNNRLVYNRHTYNGWTFVDSTYYIADDSVSNSPVITGDDNKLLVVYARKSKIYLAQSTDVGSNWSTKDSIDFATGDNTVYGIDAAYISSGNSAGLYVAYSTGQSGANPAVYFKRYNVSSNQWVEDKTVTDEGGMYGKSPSIFVSSDKVYVSFSKSYAADNSGQTKVRSRLLNSSNWDAQSSDISSLPNNNSGLSSIVVDGTYLHALVTGFKGDGTNPLYYVKKNLVNGDTTKIKLTDEGYCYVAPKLIKTADGILHAFYIGIDASYHHFFEQQQYNGSAWSAVGSKWYPASNTINDLSVCSVGNDMYVYKNYFYNGSFWIDTTQIWYNGVPATPQNMSISSYGGSKFVPAHAKVSWNANPEPDMSGYEIYRAAGSSGFGLLATVSNTQTYYEDNGVNVGSGGLTVYYKIKAKDVQNNLSVFSDQVSIGSSNFFEKKYIPMQEQPNEFSLGNNYPNPFNPSTKISYSVPEISNVKISIYDRLGREITTLVNREHQAGYYNVNFDASTLSTGVYFYTINAGKFSSTKKMILTK